MRWALFQTATGDFMKKVLLATWALRDRQIVFIKGVYTESTFFMKSAVVESYSLVLMYTYCAVMGRGEGKEAAGTHPEVHSNRSSLNKDSYIDRQIAQIDILKYRQLGVYPFIHLDGRIERQGLIDFEMDRLVKRNSRRGFGRCRLSFLLHYINYLSIPLQTNS